MNKRGKTKKRMDRLIFVGQGNFLEDVARVHGLHPNTIRKWCKRMGIFIGLMRNKESRYFKQALRSRDVVKFMEHYRSVGGAV